MYKIILIAKLGQKVYNLLKILFNTTRFTNNFFKHVKAFEFFYEFLQFLFCLSVFRCVNNKLFQSNRFSSFNNELSSKNVPFNAVIFVFSTELPGFFWKIFYQFSVNDKIIHYLLPLFYWYRFRWNLER